MCMTNFCEVLKEQGKYCNWKYEQRSGRLTKVPYQPETGYGAKSNDPGTFTSFEVALHCLNKGYDGIGIGIFDGICAIDLDHCVTEEGDISKDAADIIALMHSYTEYSPSRKGIHILFEAKGFQYDSNRYYIMNQARGMEVYVAGATSKYVTVTGNRANKYEYGDRSQELQMVLDRYMIRPQKAQMNVNNKFSAVNAVNAANELTESDIIRIASSSRSGAKFQDLYRGDTSGYLSHSEADLAFCRMLAFWTGRDPGKMDAIMRSSGLMREKWDRAESGSTYGAITIQKAIESCLEVYMPPRKMESASDNNAAQEQSLFAPVKPIKPANSDLPEFPVKCLPATIGKYVTGVSELSCTFPDMAAVISLGVLASCVQRKFLVEVFHGYTEQLSLYVAVIAAPGERKSSVTGNMVKPIYEYEKEINAKLAPQIKQNEQKRKMLNSRIAGLEKRIERAKDNKEIQSLVEKLRKVQSELEAIPELSLIRLQADDSSSEALTSLLARYGERMTVISSDGGGVFDVLAGRYSDKANIDVWLKGFSGDPIQVDRIGRSSEYIASPALTAILAIQPSVLEEIMSNKTMAGRGLLARFCYSYPASKIGTRKLREFSIPAEVEADYHDLLFRLMSVPAKNEPAKVTLSPSAREIIAECFEENEHFLAGEGQEIADWASKYIGFILRIAGLLYLAEADLNSTQLEIPAKTMENAIEIGKYFLAHARFAYAIMCTDINVKKAVFVEAKIREEHKSEMKRSDLFQKCRGKFFKKTEDIFPTVDYLEEHGYLRQVQEKKGTPGRPGDVMLYFNPEVFHE